MHAPSFVRPLLTAVALLLPAVALAQPAQKPFEPSSGQPGKDVVWVPTPQALVDKMLDLTPKMRTAKLETDKATLQNAITATDYEIDRLVYDLYGLTEDEIKLVEESSANNKEYLD